MPQKKPGKTALQRFFSGLSEFIFHSHLGVADPPLVDYLSDLLMRFSRIDTVYRMRSLRGRPIREVGEMLAEADERIGTARREIHRHIGDFTLFWAGLYPESLRNPRKAALDHFSDYCTQGKRAYLIASSIRSEDEQRTPSDVLERLGRQFELCAYGLREVRREWEKTDDDNPPSLVIE